MNHRGAGPAYRGYRVQALYTLWRMLNLMGDRDLLFQPEGNEDLDIRNENNLLLEMIQVKSYSGLVLSQLLSDRSSSFFHRVIPHLREASPPIVKVVNFGEIGPELSTAWQGDVDSKTLVSKKFAERGIGELETDLLFAHVRIESLDERTIEADVLGLLRDTLAGVDATSAFDLLQYWLYLIAEQSGTITTLDLSQRIQNVGRFLSERLHYHRHWNTTIIPLERHSLNESERSKLQNEYYSGVSARFEHIAADLDFRRDPKLQEIAEGFASKTVVIVHAASGQGKTSLAYRYMEEAYPQTWRFQVRTIQDRQTASEIATALSGYADAMKTPLGIYVDVSPHDEGWVELVSRIAHHPYLQILVTIREEDYRRSSFLGTFEFDDLDLVFDEDEARLVFERAKGVGHEKFLDFDAAWSEFGGSGPLMEFVFLLTQTSSLFHTLQAQVDRIRTEVREKKLSPDELNLLRLVSVATAYDARVHTSVLVEELQLPEPTRTLEFYESEYLLRRTAEGNLLGGLHPIRSRILVDFLTDLALFPWLKIAEQVLPYIHEPDLEAFFLHAMIDRPEEHSSILSLVAQFTPKTWTGVAAVVRSLLWAGMKDYIEENWGIIEAARDEFGQGWYFVADLNFAGEDAPNIDGWWRDFEQLIPPDRQEKLDKIRKSQTPKKEAFRPLENWLRRLPNAPPPPTSVGDWSGFAEATYWAQRVGLTDLVLRQLPVEQLSEVTESLPLLVLAEVSLALYLVDKESHAQWLVNSREILDRVLAQEFRILSVQENEDTLIAHYLPASAVESQDDGQAGEDIRSSDPLHDEMRKRIYLMRHLFPSYAKYGATGYGYRFGEFNLPYDSGHNPGVSRRNLVPRWPLTINGIATGLPRYRYRPVSWNAYIDEMMSTRHSIVTCLDQLLLGLAKSFERANSPNIIGDHVDSLNWVQCELRASEIPDLPRVAVDPWGFASEQAIERRHLEDHQRFLPSAISLQSYGSFLKVQRDYFFSIRNFLQQSVPVMTTNFVVRGFAKGTLAYETRITALRAQGINTDLGHLSTHNLFQARLALLDYQQQFKELFGQRLVEEEINALEEVETRVLSSVWKLWYFYAHSPEKRASRSLQQIPGWVAIAKMEFEKSIQTALKRVEDDETELTVLSQNLLWNGKSALWITLNISDALKIYQKLEELVASFREVIGSFDIPHLNTYFVEEYLEYTVVVPLVRGQMISDLVWAMRSFTAFRNSGASQDQFWQFMPSQLPKTSKDALGLREWQLPALQQANQFTSSVSGMMILTSQLADVANMPDVPDIAIEVAKIELQEKVNEVNRLLQDFFDIASTLLDIYSSISEREKVERPELCDAVATLIDLHREVRPSEDFNGTAELSMQEIAQYSQRLSGALEAAETVRLLWIDDILRETRTEPDER